MCLSAEALHGRVTPCLRRGEGGHSVRAMSQLDTQSSEDSSQLRQSRSVFLSLCGSYLAWFLTTSPLILISVLMLVMYLMPTRFLSSFSFLGGQNMMCLCVFSLFHCGILSVSWICGLMSFFHCFNKSLSIIPSNISSDSLSPSLFFLGCQLHLCQTFRYCPKAFGFSVLSIFSIIFLFVF